MPHKKILIVEDDAMIRENLRDFLESEGYSAEVAANGKEGLDAIRRSGGECLVLLDLQMPVMTGEEMLEALRKESDPKIRDIPILVLSARAEDFRHREIVGFIRKPLDLDRLLSEVQKHCTRPV